ncbi:type I restriction endonuclease subunit M [Vibrio mediterranei]
MMNVATEPSTSSLTYVCTAEPFELGQCVMTRGIEALLRDNLGASLHIYLMRHQNGDWGNTPIEDKITNDEATRTEGRIMSSYTLCGETIWIITEWDRSVTTVLLPQEY